MNEQVQSTQIRQHKSHPKRFRDIKIETAVLTQNYISKQLFSVVGHL